MASLNMQFSDIHLIKQSLNRKEVLGILDPSSDLISVRKSFYSASSFSQNLVQFFEKKMVVVKFHFSFQ